MGKFNDDSDSHQKQKKTKKIHVPVTPPSRTRAQLKKNQEKQPSRPPMNLRSQKNEKPDQREPNIPPAKTTNVHLSPDQDGNFEGNIDHHQPTLFEALRDQDEPKKCHSVKRSKVSSEKRVPFDLSNSRGKNTNVFPNVKKPTPKKLHFTEKKKDEEQ